MPSSCLDVARGPSLACTVCRSSWFAELRRRRLEVHYMPGQLDLNTTVSAAMYHDHIAIGKKATDTAGQGDAQQRGPVVDHDRSLGNRHSRQGGQAGGALGWGETPLRSCVPRTVQSNRIVPKSASASAATRGTTCDYLGNAQQCMQWARLSSICVSLRQSEDLGHYSSRQCTYSQYRQLVSSASCEVG